MASMSATTCCAPSAAAVSASAASLTCGVPIIRPQHGPSKKKHRRFRFRSSLHPVPGDRQDTDMAQKEAGCTEPGLCCRLREDPGLWKSTTEQIAWASVPNVQLPTNLKK